MGLQGFGIVAMATQRKAVRFRIADRDLVRNRFDSYAACAWFMLAGARVWQLVGGGKSEPSQIWQAA